MRNRSYAFALLALIAVLVAGCGSSESGQGGSETATYRGAYGGAGGEPASSGGKAGQAAVVSLASVHKLGMVLVDSSGMTLYDFHKDKGTTSSCYTACAVNWPPLITRGEPQVGNGAAAARVGTTKRNDGSLQVTYAGHPLYTFVGDRKPGEGNGNDVDAFGGQWYALHGNGEDAQG